MSYNKIQASIAGKPRNAIESLRSSQNAAVGRDKAIAGLNKMSQAMNPYMKMMAYQTLAQNWRGYQEGKIDALAGENTEQKSFYRDASAYLQEKTAHRKNEAERLENIKVANVYGIIAEQSGLQNRAEEYFGGLYSVGASEEAYGGSGSAQFSPDGLAGLSATLEGGSADAGWSNAENLLSASFWQQSSSLPASPYQSGGESAGSAGSSKGRHVKPASSIGSMSHLYGNPLGITDPFALNAQLYGTGGLLTRPLESSVAENYAMETQQPVQLMTLPGGMGTQPIYAESYGFQLGSSLNEVDRQSAFFYGGQSASEGEGFTYFKPGTKEYEEFTARQAQRDARRRAQMSAGFGGGEAAYYSSGMQSGSEALSDLSISKVAIRLSRIAATSGGFDPFGAFEPVPNPELTTKLKGEIEQMKRQAKSRKGQPRAGGGGGGVRQKATKVITLADVQAGQSSSESGSGGGRFEKFSMSSMRNAY